MAKNAQDRWLAGLRNWASDAQSVLENVAKAVIVLAMLGSMFIFGVAADPVSKSPHVPFADRILSWSFVVFSVGLAELFVLFVVMTVLGKIDLAQAFYDKTESPAPAAAAAGDGDAEAEGDGAGKEPPGSATPANPPKAESPPVSLSRLQAFLWTLVVMTIYFHRVVKDGNNGIPPIPPELLMVMGISGATFLISKGISSSSGKQKKGEE